MADYDSVETSEFSLLEVLYMGHEGLTFYVESMIEVALSDPFEILAAMEEHMGKAIVFWQGEPEM